ncbi:MAG: HNH endonuclease [Betaproteobacteria bacterium]
MTYETYAARFSKLVVNTSQGRASPHKICMLLAMLDLARAGGLQENRIHYGPALLERYRRFFDAVKAPGDHANPSYPFFHLRGKLRGRRDSFWHLVPKEGREVVLSSMSSARSPVDIDSNVAFATLDPELHAAIQNPQVVDRLIADIGKHWFNRGLEDLAVVVDRSATVSRYERALRSGAPAGTDVEVAPPAVVRSSAFRRVVTEVYDYRCAATGVRVLLPNGEAMVEAAHIHPFSETGDDDPRNGLALSPDMHWAMDRNLIAPGPDFRWRVSKLLDRRIPDFRHLCDLDGRELLLPGEPRMYPKRESLEWRVERLRDPDWTAPDAMQRQP